MLGFLPDTPRNKLYGDPWLPQWIPDLIVQNLRIGRHKLDVRFWRDGDGTAFRVLRGDTSIVERCELGAKLTELRSNVLK
jgi:hypothetical protein